MSYKLDNTYRDWINELKTKVRSSQAKAILAVNTELIQLYWELGGMISKKLDESDWGDKVISNISNDLREEFPDMGGLSQRNLKYCKSFFLFYSNSISQQAVAQIPWGHNILIFTKCDDVETALFYVRQTIENQWSRATLKDPYVFDFLQLDTEYREKDIENQLIHHINRFLLELGKGFAFVGQQYSLIVSEKEYFIDLLFYHTRLKCYVVIELKNTAFKPEYTGKLNFYLSAVDSLVKMDNDNPSIGLLLCREKDGIEAEFALRDIQKPIGISEYILTKELPDDLKSSLPTIEEIERQLRFENDDKK